MVLDKDGDRPSPISQRPIGHEESIAKSLQQLTTPEKENLDFLTEADDEEILNLTALKLWASETGFSILDQFCDNFERLRVSRYRQGRREITLSVGLASGGSVAGRPKSVRDLLSLKL
jgi:hypothetical protein